MYAITFILNSTDIVPMKNNWSNQTLIAFGKHLRKVRERKGISQEKLGLLANSYQSTVIRIEQGKSNPKLTTVIAFAKVLGIEPKELLDFK